MGVDKFAKSSSILDSPGKSAYAVVPANDTELAVYSRQVYVGGTGNLNVIMVGDTANTLFSAVQVGTMLPIRVKVIHSTGTTATNIVAVY
jgi:hypothetical protein